MHARANRSWHRPCSIQGVLTSPLHLRQEPQRGVVIDIAGARLGDAGAQVRQFSRQLRRRLADSGVIPAPAPVGGPRLRLVPRPGRRVDGGRLAGHALVLAHAATHARWRSSAIALVDESAVDGHRRQGNVDWSVRFSPAQLRLVAARPVPADDAEPSPDGQLVIGQ